MTHRIVILGAGYAGLAAAKRTARLLRAADVELTLVNRTDRFVERVRLHQLAAGQRLRNRALPDVLAGSGVRFTAATVNGIDLDGRAVSLDAEPGTLRFDTLVYALGSEADIDMVPGVSEHAFTLAGAGQARRLCTHVSGLPSGASLVVVGGGLTGIEAATELAETRPDVRVELACGDRLGGDLSDRARLHLERVFTRMGIAVHEGRRVIKVGPDSVHLDDGQSLHTDAVVWAAGFRVPRIAAEAGLSVDAHGRMVVDNRLRSVSHPEVHGIGDAAAAPAAGGGEARMSCQTGLPMGQYVAGAIAREVTGRVPQPVRLRYVWQNISLGRRDGVTQFTRTDDTPLRAVLTGRTSAWFKEAITRGAAWMAQR